jgi:hypothetical protein
MKIKRRKSNGNFRGCTGKKYSAAAGKHHRKSEPARAWFARRSFSNRICPFAVLLKKHFEL